jgi:hypothetical protein
VLVQVPVLWSVYVVEEVQEEVLFLIQHHLMELVLEY